MDVALHEWGGLQFCGVHHPPGGERLILLGRSGQTDAEVGSPVIIRLADTDYHRNSARMLVNQMYGWRGYGADHEIPALPHYTTFTASTDLDDVIGTLTLGIDTPAGLSIDRIFKEELDQFRSIAGTRVCELTKLAFKTQGPSKPLLASLFHIIFIFGENRYGCTDLFIEVNPRHVRFYEAMLGFQRVGSVKTNLEVDAPSQLMWLQISTIRARIDAEAAQSGSGDGRSLYRYFFSEREARGIYDRLAQSCHCQSERDTEHSSRSIGQFAPRGQSPAIVHTN